MISQTEYLIMKKFQDEKLHPEKRKQLIEYEDAQAEKEIHADIEAWLRRNDIKLCVHPRIDKKSTIEEGWPDFTVIRKGKVACAEIKTRNGKLSDAQCRIHREMEADGTPICVCRSLLEATRFFRKVLFP